MSAQGYIKTSVPADVQDGRVTVLVAPHAAYIDVTKLLSLKCSEFAATVGELMFRAEAQAAKARAAAAPAD